jgi:hypothetical protein
VVKISITVIPTTLTVLRRGIRAIDLMVLAQKRGIRTIDLKRIVESEL